MVGDVCSSTQRLYKTEAATGAEMYVIDSGVIIFLHIFQSNERPSTGLVTIAELPAVPVYIEYFQIVLQLYRYDGLCTA